MYIFHAHYTRFSLVDNDQPIVKKIKVEEQFFANERDVFLYVMGQAYDLQQTNEIFDGLELICC